MENKSLQKKIMRRIYYAYALQTISMPGVLPGLSMFAILMVLTRFVSLGNVISNIMHVGFWNLGQFFYNAVTNTSAWTLLLLGAFIFSALSFRFKITHWKQEPVFVKI